MMLVEQTPVPAAALPVAAFRDHLRLGTGFSDDGVQDAVLESCLRAALAMIEAATSKAILARGFVWQVTAWRDLARAALPVAPVGAITELRVVDDAGAIKVVDASSYRLKPDFHRPVLVATGLALPSIPVGGVVEVEFTAGYGAVWSDVPADLAQAVLVQAARLYERRDGEPGMAADVRALVARYREVRLFAGRGA